MFNNNVDLYHGDCLTEMLKIPDNSIDMVLCDPPYGTTACKWDSAIPFADMWNNLNRVVKQGGAVVLFGAEPFSSALRMSNIKNYKYDWYWLKNFKTGHLNAHRQPMRSIEVASVFYNKQCHYFPQGLKPYGKIKNRGVGAETNNKAGCVNYQECTGFPDNRLDFPRDKECLHPTQKPVAMLEYLIKTYTNVGETILDFTMGSGSTGVAAVNTNRRFIGIELDDKYFEIAKNRIEDNIHKINEKS